VRIRRPSGAPTLALILLLPYLAGCGGLLSGPPQRQLYRLTPEIAFPGGRPHLATQLLVAMPTAPAGLDTTRIALARSPVSLDYFADAEWTDRAPFLVQTALIDGFRKSGAIAAVGAGGGDLRADFVLESAIGDFEAVYDSPNGPPQVVVQLSVQLVRMPARNIVAHRSVRATARAAANAIPAVVRAFNIAVGKASEDVVNWAVTTPGLSDRR
jgi:cholesterol transport system auxiliary component